MKKVNILIIISLFILSSCNINCTESGGFFRGNGIIKMETRNVTDFSQLKSSGSIDVEIVAGNKFGLKVEDDENLLSHLITEVKNGELNIYYDNNLSIGESHGKVFVEVPMLNKISSSGSGNIKIEGSFTSDKEIVIASSGSGNINMDGSLKSEKEILISISGSGDVEGNVDAPSIRLNTSGSGDISLKGETKNLDCKTVGSGNIKCRNLKSENVVVNVAGSSDVFVFASVSLKVDIAGSGDVTYAGNPTSPSINVRGSGDVKKAD